MYHLCTFSTFMRKKTYLQSTKHCHNTMYITVLHSSFIYRKIIFLNSAIKNIRLIDFKLLEEYR